MSKLMTIFGMLTISFMADAGIYINRSLPDASVLTIGSSDQRPAAEANGKKLTIRFLNNESLELPFLNAKVAARIADEIESGSNVYCDNAAYKTNLCEALIIDRHSFQVDRSKLYPEYYKTIEEKCLEGIKGKDAKKYYGILGNKETKMHFGVIDYTEPDKMNPLIGLAMGASSLYHGGGWGIQTYSYKGPESYIPLSDVYFRNILDFGGPELIRVGLWMEFDSTRRKVVLLERLSCKTAGEISY